MSVNSTNTLLLGIDIGSTTAKLVLLDGEEIIYSKYERHFSKVREKILQMLIEIKDMLSKKSIKVAISGSAGMGLALSIGIAFAQEVFVVGEVIRKKEPDTCVVIELGGEDAKIIFFDGTPDERMNGSCAGGTGAFIDQMATLLCMTNDEMDAASLEYTRIYPIASRCGVFAKTDIQPLLNQGASKQDVAASIYRAVVNQTIGGLAQGRKIKGKVMFLGGPLYYCLGLRRQFVEVLGLDDSCAVFPEYAIYAVALGTAYYADKNGTVTDIDALIHAVSEARTSINASGLLPPLFDGEQDYKLFFDRHSKATVKQAPIDTYSGKAYLGIDCGSTTTKLVLLSESNEILYSYYSSNRGNPVEVVKEQLFEIYKRCTDSGDSNNRIEICGSAVTGYGEELIKNAFGVDIGIVETIAHYTAARFFCPEVDFILDIGGQDIKCFKIRNGAIDSIMLNEACSSGCGSFLETFAKSMGYSIEDFAKKGIYGNHPVNLGSRCTVFMNSSVKQAQKDGAGVEDISAGLSISVVKNAIYKVIRAASADELGKNVVVQGGTFYNDAVLRAFERELGRNVIRPSIAGLMGAYGAALYSKKCERSNLISRKELESFTHSAKSVTCRGCTNSCSLTINTFKDGRKFISGNRCEKGLGIEKTAEAVPNLYEFKRNALLNMSGKGGERGRIGLPLALGMYELLPLWSGIFKSLGFEVVIPEMTTRRTYEKGQLSIPSDTVCYPAKLMHGHVEELLSKGVDAIFYPCLTYNIDEKASDNHYNCPVVAYYSELLSGNVDSLAETKFLYPYLNINNKSELAKELSDYLTKKFCSISLKEAKKAVKEGFKVYGEYMEAVRREGERALRYADEKGKRVMILAGRPYHIDSEICHGIDELAKSLGFVIVSEDSICHLSKPVRVRVLNQWTYHARLYRAAMVAAKRKNTELVQLVSFGCGVDAITTDEVRAILEDNGKLYTQIKIDEITNLGAVKIRLRSLIGAIEEKEAKREEGGTKSK